MPIASVVVCTCNRSAALVATVNALERLAAPAGWQLEVLVVDNASNDGTRQVIEAAVARSPDRFRYLYEGAAGKSNALNAALAAVSGDLLLVTDDDCLVEPDWAQKMVAEFERDPDLDLVGGRVELHDPVDRPVTIRTFDETIVFDSTAQLFSLIPGCNLAFTRRALQRVGPFDPRLGPGSRRRLVAEDTDFLYRALRAGLRMIYSPQPCVRHAHGRRTDAQVAALHRTYLRGRGALYCKHILRGDGTALRMAYWELSGCLRAALRSPRRWRGEAAVIAGLAAGAGSWLREAVRSGGGPD